MTTYISLFIAFGATLIALRGNTWDNQKKGWVRLTLFGWATAGMALLGLTSAIITTYESKREASEINNLIRDFNIPSLAVDWKVDPNRIDLVVGNDSRFTLLVDEIAVNWIFSPIEEQSLQDYLDRSMGIPVRSNLLDLTLSPREGKKSIIETQHKFGPGDLEKWQTKLAFSKTGAYTVWVTIVYRSINKGGRLVFETDREVLYVTDAQQGTPADAKKQRR